MVSKFGILYRCLKGNKTCGQRFIEHGYNTYLNEYGKKPWYLGLLIKLAGYKCMDGSMLEGLYMYNPSLLKVHQDGEIRKMPYMNKENRKFVETLNYIFEFNPDNNEFKNKKTIIMEQGPLKAEFNIEKFWEKVLQGIDKEQAIIKAHPRQKESALQNIGIDVSRNNTIPWEVVALNLDMENKVQLAIFSGSCIMPKTCCNIESRVILLYKLLPVDYSFFGKKILDLTEEIGTKYNDKNKFFVPNSFDELCSYLTEYCL